MGEGVLPVPPLPLPLAVIDEIVSLRSPSEALIRTMGTYQFWVSQSKKSGLHTTPEGATLIAELFRGLTHPQSHEARAERAAFIGHRESGKPPFASGLTRCRGVLSGRQDGSDSQCQNENGWRVV